MLGPIKSRDLNRPVPVSLETLVSNDDPHRQLGPHR